jgi:hypothetical protein
MSDIRGIGVLVQGQNLACMTSGDERAGDGCADLPWRGPVRVENMRGYFYRVMTREATRMREQPRAAPAEDIVALSDRGQQPAPWPGGTAEADHGSEAHLLELLNQIRRRQSELLASVPRRSADPRRYQQAMVAAAEAILRATLEQEPSTWDWAAIIREGYPEWYDAAVPPGTAYQRLSRARGDVQQLLGVLLKDKLLLSAPPPGDVASPA